MFPHGAHVRLPDKALLCKRSLKKVCRLNPAAWLCFSRTDFVRVNKHLVNEQDFPRTVFEACIWGEAAVILLWQKIICWSFSWNDFALLHMIGSCWHRRLFSSNQTSCSTHTSWDICQSRQKPALCAEH